MKDDDDHSYLGTVTSALCLSYTEKKAATRLPTLPFLCVQYCKALLIHMVKFASDTAAVVLLLHLLSSNLGRTEDGQTCSKNRCH